MSSSISDIARYLKKEAYNIIFYAIFLLFVGTAFMVFDKPSAAWLIYLFFLPFAVLEIISTFLIISRKPKGEFLVRRRKRAYVLGISIFLFCLSAWQYWLLQHLKLKTQLSVPFAAMTGFGILTICQLIVYCLFRVYRPVSLVINGCRLLLYDRTVKDFNLENLTTVKLNDTEACLVLQFTGKKWVKIIIQEFARQDLLSFIPAAIALSKHPVEVKPAVYRKLNPPPPSPPLPFFRRIAKGLKDTFLP